MTKISKTDKILLTAAILCSVFLLLVNLGGGGIPAAQEGRTAIIVKNMILTGNWMDMQANDGIPYEKPIGHYWLCLPFAGLFHAQNVDLTTCASEWAFRLPSALSAMTALAAAMLLAFRIFGARTAALTAFILSTSATFLHLGRLAHIDMPLCAAFSWSMAFLYIGYLEEMKSNRWLYGFYICLGWGMILKGPLVVILAGLTVLAMMAVSRRWKMIWELRPLTGGAVFLLVALPWYIVEIVRTDGAFFEEFIMKQNISRFTGVGSTYRNGERMPLLYYIPKMTAGMLPWSIPALCAAVCYFKRLIRLRFSIGPLFLLMWFATGFIFFSLSALKRGDYLLPVYPALGILTAEAVRRGCEKLPKLTKYWVWFPVALVIFLAGSAALSFSGAMIRFAQARLEGKMKYIGRSDANNLLLISSWVNDHVFIVLVSAVILLLLVILLGILMRRGKYNTVLAVFCGIVFCVYAFYCGYLDPVSGDKYRSVKPFAVQVRQIVPETETVLIAGDYNTEMLYFLNRIYHYQTEGEDPLQFRYIAASDTVAAELNEKYPGRWQELFRTVENHQYPAVFLRRIEPRQEVKP